MNIKRTKVLGSDYLGLFAITNDKLCFVPDSIDTKSAKIIESTLDVKVVKTLLYDSSLLAVFAKMNNHEIFIPEYAIGKEIELIEKEIKVNIVNTNKALGNLIEINDDFAVISKTLKEVTKLSKLTLIRTNIAETDAIGSALLLTNKSFLINPNASKEEIKNLQQTLNLNGGSSTANTGDAFIRNSMIANKNGAVVGEQTTGHEMNRIEETLEG
ncbi:MAG: translation initiation factor IF-6 [archaeon]|jgi:translation initiation factor 6